MAFSFSGYEILLANDEVILGVTAAAVRAAATVGAAASAVLFVKDWRLLVGVVSAAGVSAAGVVAFGGVGGFIHHGAAVLNEFDVLRDEVVDALAVDNLERWHEVGHHSLDESRRGLLLVGSGSLDELDVELAESEQFDGIALLQVLLDVVRIAVEHVEHVSRGERRLVGNLVGSLRGGERAVVHWFHTEDVVNVVLVELNLVTGHFVCFGHDS